jgi:3-methyladenine DNA glycosylase AlkD
MTNKHLSELLSQVRTHAKRISKSEREKLERYIGTNKTLCVMGADTQRKIIKEWTKKHPDLTQSEYIELLSSLYQGDSVNEISLAGELLGSFPKLRENVEPKHLDAWLNNVRGWAEVDSICQSKFTAEELLSNWKEWKHLLTRLASDENIHKKRACLVLLTKPVRDSEDTILANLAFMNIDKLKKEREILVTKAVSWLLRALVKHHRRKVETYLKENQNAIPKIALRETRKKLLTGRKTPQPIIKQK